MTAPSRDASPDAPPLLEARDIWKAFPGVQALAAAGITVRPGRLTALLGENGAGKSTLMNILAGVFPPDSGTLALDGQPVSFRSPREAQDAGVSIIFQELNLVDGLSVAENIFLGRQPQNAWGLVDHARMRRDAAAILAALDIDIEPSLPVERLKVGARQMVEIAKALSFASRVLILDEPTSALTQHEAETLFRVIAKLKAQGVGMVYITTGSMNWPASPTTSRSFETAGWFTRPPSTPPTAVTTCGEWSAATLPTVIAASAFPPAASCWKSNGSRSHGPGRPRRSWPTSRWRSAPARWWGSSV